MFRRLCSGLPLLIALLLSSSTHAQGLREAALELLAELEGATGAEACRQAAAAEALLTEIERVDARAFMGDEVGRLEQAAAAAGASCAASVDNPGNESQRLEQLLARCLALGQSRAHCSVRRECAEVAQGSPRMGSFWEAAQGVHCPP